MIFFLSNLNINDYGTIIQPSGVDGCDLEQWAKENDKWDKMTLVLFGTVYIVSSS
jgi:hypothetical protein